MGDDSVLLTGHWLTTVILEELGRVFSALRATHEHLVEMVC